MSGCGGGTLRNFAILHRMGGVEEDRFAAWRAEVKRRRELVYDLNYRQASARTNGGMSDQRWRNLENGFETRGQNRNPANPSRAGVIAIARALEWDLADALALAGFEPPTGDEDARPPTDPLQRIQVAWRRLTARQREAAAEAVESMAFPITPSAPVRVDTINADHPEVRVRQVPAPNGEG